MHPDTTKGPRGTCLRTDYFPSRALDEEKHARKAGPFFSPRQRVGRQDSTTEVTIQVTPSGSDS